MYFCIDYSLYFTVNNNNYCYEICVHICVLSIVIVYKYYEYQRTNSFFIRFEFDLFIYLVV